VSQSGSISLECATLQSEIRNHVETGSTVFSDEYRSYKSLSAAVDFTMIYLETPDAPGVENWYLISSAA
jgi:hypothetical protein